MATAGESTRVYLIRNFVSVAFVDFVPLWCDHQAISHCRTDWETQAKGVCSTLPPLRPGGVKRKRWGARLTFVFSVV